MRRLVATFAALSLLASGAGAAAALRGGPPPIPSVPGQWSHVELNTKIRRQPHTLILDRGRIMQASASQLVLRRNDGTNATIPLSAETIITFSRMIVTPNALKRGEYAVTMVVDGGAAARVKVTLRP
jgi:hypothetical protein